MPIGSLGNRRLEVRERPSKTFSKSLISCTCAAVRMKEAKMTSMPFLHPKVISALSFSETAGRFTLALGRLTPRRSDSVAPLMATHVTSIPEHPVT